VGGGAVTHLAAGILGDAGPLTIWAVVLVFVFLECAFVLGLFLPGDSLLFAAGVLLADRGDESSAWLLGAVATAVAVAGNQVGYLVGRHTGTRMLARKEGRVLNRANLARATAFFERWGFWAIVVARWIPWVRTLAPMIAGAARMDNRRYILANAVGALCWVPSLILLGFYGAGLLDAAPWLKPTAAVLAVAGFVGGSAVGLYRFRQEMRRPIDEGARHPEDAFRDGTPRRDGATDRAAEPVTDPVAHDEVDPDRR
jgi:membrane-associated protein